PKLDDTVAQNFNRIVLARWGDAVLPNAPPFNPNALTGDQASTQFPYDAVIAALINPPPAQDGIPRLVMVLANPTAPARMVFPGGVDNPDVAGRLQGATIINLQYQAGRWVTVDGGYQSRRITDGTLCQISGPVAASIGTTVQGIIAPQAGCATPWGTALLAEGNAGPWLTRLANVGLGFADPNNAPRFGWVAELDALHPLSFPIKRTALGRFARSGIAATTATDGRAVIFMSQDDPAGFLLRFIAATATTDGSALDSGTLSVAQINGSTITWIDLGTDIPTLAGTVAAAAAAGGSAFDAPGGIAIAPGNGAIDLACRGNNARNTPDALNPRVGDDNGHVLAFSPPGGDVTAKTFPGKMVLAAGNPATTPSAQYTPGSNGWLKKPRTLNLDPLGQLWIGTDQEGRISDTADGLFIMQTGGPSPYLITTAYLAPIGAAIGGAAFDAATKTSFGAVRHPGATPTASFDAPATRWPTLQPTMPPQTTIIGLVSR
ncbi:MAG TPA: alkaline phosphatase PhoX, partial [Acidocella sp.]|nr:alkaline phosphatase PhoX [Acidocella sp.]